LTGSSKNPQNGQETEEQHKQGQEAGSLHPVLAILDGPVYKKLVKDPTQSAEQKTTLLMRGVLTSYHTAVTTWLKATQVVWAP